MLAPQMFYIPLVAMCIERTTVIRANIMCVMRGYKAGEAMP